MFCNICSHPSILFDKAKVLNKYDVQYFQCTACGFVQTEESYWLNESYSDAITKSDLGLIARNLNLSRISKLMIILFFNQDAKFIDYGGGYGMLVRMMRDFGFDFYRSDKFCDNLFAYGFDADVKGADQYELLTAFEVFEHLPDPLGDLEKMLSFSKNILFSTLLIPASQPKPNRWWYYGLEHGQHISLFTPEALRFIADKFNLKLYSNGSSLHLLTEKKINPLLFSLVSRGKIAQMLHIYFNRKSLLPKDYQLLTGTSLK
jgi:Methyltransferase domain